MRGGLKSARRRFGRPADFFLGVIATLLILGGTAAAAKFINGSKIKPHSITAKQVKAHSLPLSVFKGSIPSGAAGPTGANGPTGTQGPSGSTGVIGPSGVTGAQGPGALKLDFLEPSSDNQLRVVGTVDELTVLARCSLVPLAELEVFVQSSVAGAGIAGTNQVSLSGAPPTPQSFISSGVNTSPATPILDLNTLTPPNPLKQSVVVATFLTSNHVISLQLYAAANSNAQNCELHGTAVPAS
jgi:hypothetical protein